MNPETRLDRLTQWLANLTPALTVQNAPPAVRGVAQALLVDLLTYIRLHPETDPDFLAMREQIVAEIRKLDEGKLAAARSLMEKQGPGLWRELHLRQPAGDDSAWLAQFTARIPCVVCKQHWLKILRSNPPRWADFFAWTVEVHNAVNALLGKPQFTVEQARPLYA